MNWFEIYLLTRLGFIHDICGIVSILFGVVLFVAMCIFFSAFGKGEQDIRSACAYMFKWLFPIWFLCLCGVAFIPTNKQLAIIFSGYWATNSEQVKALPDKVVKTMNKFLDEYLEEK